MKNLGQKFNNKVASQKISIQTTWYIYLSQKITIYTKFMKILFLRYQTELNITTFAKSKHYSIDLHLKESTVKPVIKRHLKIILCYLKTEKHKVTGLSVMILNWIWSLIKQHPRNINETRLQPRLYCHSQI